MFFFAALMMFFAEKAFTIVHVADTRSVVEEFFKCIGEALLVCLGEVDVGSANFSDIGDCTMKFDDNREVV